MILAAGAVLAALLGAALARADSNCSVGGGPLAVGAFSGGAQVCLNVIVVGGTVVVTPNYAAADGRASNPEPADGYVGADLSGAYACASGEYNPGGGNNPITNLLNAPCSPQPGV